MKNIKNTTELYLKIYFQIRFYLFLASIHYLLFNYSFTFDINAGDLVFLFMYIFAVILLIFSGIYCYLLSRIITKDLSKKAVFYINSTLLTLSLCLFIYGAFITKNNSIESTILVLLPFLSFNIVSWLITKRAIDKNIITSKKFLRNTFIGWIIFSVIFFLIGSFQPYNRVVIPSKIIEININDYPIGLINLKEFQNNYKDNYFFNDYLYCMKSPEKKECFDSEIFGDKLRLQQKTYKDSGNIIQSDIRTEVYKSIIYDSIDNDKLNELLLIESELQKVVKFGFYKTPIEYKKNNILPGTFSKLNVFYQNTISYLIDTKRYSQANKIINNYIGFLRTYNIIDPFSYHLNSYPIIYYKRLEESGHNSIIYPENIEGLADSILSTFTRSYLDDYKSELYYGLPDFLFILNKKQLIKHKYYHVDLIYKNLYTFTYYPFPIHYPLGAFIIKFQGNFDYIDGSKKATLSLKNYILERE